LDSDQGILTIAGFEGGDFDGVEDGGGDGEHGGFIINDEDVSRDWSLEIG
jgi:hypothetical protein